MAKRIKTEKVGKTVTFEAKPKGDPLLSSVENKADEAVLVRIRQGDVTIKMSLSRFLEKFETPKQKSIVQSAVYSLLRTKGKTKQQIDAKRAELMKDQRSRAAYWNADGWGSISGFQDAERWVEGELEKFMNS